MFIELCLVLTEDGAIINTEDRKGFLNKKKKC